MPVLACVLASLAALMALVPAALAQGPAESEYDLGPLPGAGGDNEAQSSAGEAESTTPAEAANAPSTPATESGDESGAAAPIAGGGKGNGPGPQANRSPDGAAAGNDNTSTAAERPAKPVAAESDGGGGAPVLLILLIVVAAICTGLAVWRLRGDDADDDIHGVGPTTGERQSA